jgi:RNA polymerase sigma-70 factor (ECF subfamily)
MHPVTRGSAGSQLPDDELARRVGATGDAAAFTLLMRRHNQSLYRAARSILKDDAEAEDAVQEAYIQAYRSMGRFRGESKLSTWMMRIAVNEALERTRKRSRRAEVIHLDGDTRPESEAPEATMNQATPEQPEHGAQRAETRRLLEKKIDALPDAFRTVFVLRAIEDLSVEETALTLGIPEATVRSRFFRARGLLRESLAREIDSAFEDAFAFAGARCDRIVAGVLAKINKQSPKGE